MSFWTNMLDNLGFKARATEQMSDPNFSGGMQVWTPGQPIWSDKNYATFIRDGYKKNPTVYACINLICTVASGIEWKLYTDRTRKQTIDKHPLLDLWRRPNPSVPGTGSFIEQVFGHWHISGNAYIYALRPTPNQPPIALWALRPDRMKAVASTKGVQGYVYGYGTENPVDYDVKDILHMKFPGYDDDIYGLSPIQVASYFSDQQNEAMGWNTALMQNAGRPASVFFAKGILTPEQRNQIQAEIKKKYSGKRNAGRPLILEADMDWKNMSLTPMELDFLKSYELSTRQIASILMVAPELIGDSAGKTFANVAEARQGLHIENVLPKLDRKTDYLNSWLVPMYPDLCDKNGNAEAYFAPDRDDIEALQPLYDAKKKSVHDLAREDWMAGGITLNEYRDAIGQDELDNGDCLRIGGILVSIDSLEAYADQSLTMPAMPPTGVPEPLNGPKPALPGQAPMPALPAPGTKANIWQPDNIDKTMNGYSADGITHLRWIVDGNPCAICRQNENEMVEVGDAFASGHLAPPAHPNCKCSVATFSYGEMGKANIDELARKVAHYILSQKQKGHKAHDETTVIDATSGLVGVDALQLRSMPVQTKAAPSEEGQHRLPAEAPTINEKAPDSGKRIITRRDSGKAYRDFIDRTTK